MISAVIVTYNEANKLEGCLKSLQGFADEIIVVDLGSQDETKRLIRSCKVSLYHHKWVPYADPIRNFAISKASGPWILMLDPDERITKTLAAKLKELTKKTDFSAANIPSKNIFFGKWIKHTNFWPDRHTRFFKKGCVSWLARVHSYPQVRGEITNLPAEEPLAIIHYGYDNYRQFIQKQLRYSTSEAKNRLSSGERFSVIPLVWKPIREFGVRFIKHQGYRDGIYGALLVLGLMVYQVLVQIKMLLLDKKNLEPY